MINGKKRCLTFSRFAIILVLLCNFVLAVFVAENVQGEPKDVSLPNSDVITSPEGDYKISIIHRPFSRRQRELNSFTLTLSRGEKILSRFPTIGYLLHAHWSPDGKYVAVNNRRANSGDYLWVFSLRDGKALRTPGGDKSPLEGVHRKFLDCPENKLNRYFTSAQGWESNSKLNVNTAIYYIDLNNEFVSVNAIYEIRDGRLQLVSKSIEKTPWPDHQ